MNIIETVLNFDQNKKMELMEFVYNNSNSFILNTFGFIWESRQWWGMQPIQVYKKDGNIVGLHAFTTNHKGPGVLKTYYIITDKTCRGEGIARELTSYALNEYKDICKTFFVNSEEGSDGVYFYKLMFDNQYTTTVNEFGSKDFIFQKSITEILCNLK
jgi:predicted GNAT family acetyltransferase